MAEKVGMKSFYLSGYSMALHNAWPDMGFLTRTEVARIASMVASATSLPVIADADDGYATRSRRSNGAGVHEDRRRRHPSGDQRFPKRCGHIAGKTSSASRRPWQ